MKMIKNRDVFIFCTVFTASAGTRLLGGSATVAVVVGLIVTVGITIITHK